jgi:hypothetical protein
MIMALELGLGSLLPAGLLGVASTGVAALEHEAVRARFGVFDGAVISAGPSSQDRGAGT